MRYWAVDPFLTMNYWALVLIVQGSVPCAIGPWRRSTGPWTMIYRVLDNTVQVH